MISDKIESSATLPPNPSISIKQMPPGPKGYPLIGVIPSMLKKNPLDYFMACQANYGDIFTLDFGLLKAVVLCSPHHAQYILRDEPQKYDKGGSFWNSMRSIMGNGLATSQGEFWKRQRRMIQPHFHRQKLANLTNKMVDAIEDATGYWDRAAESGRAFQIAEAYNHVTMKVIVRTILGSSLNFQEADEVGSRIEYIISYIMQGTLLNLLPNWVPSPGRERYRLAKQKIDDVIFRIIDQCRQSPDTHQDDLMSMLLHMVDDESGEQMTNEQLRDEIATIFLAGYETTSISLSWATAFLIQHPEIAEKLYKEVDSVLNGRKPTFEDLPNLPYARMILQESMRYYSPSWWIPRNAAEDDTIDGYLVPKGSLVICLNHAIHHHPDYWENPEKFDPERHTHERSAQRHRFAWNVFGAGQRQCLGKDFALMEGHLVLVRLAQRYVFKPVPDYVLETKIGTTLKPKNGVLVYLEKRPLRYPVTSND